MSNAGRIPTVTPCAGRCSTTFGDHVCRGCRRFNHEIIRWNSYTEAQQLAIWKRLDLQLDQILIPMLPHANLTMVTQFLLSKRVRVLAQATTGRQLYYALRLCEKNKHLADDSGLGVTAEQVKPLWREFERRILSLAQASYDLAWLRADGIQHSLLQVSMED
ncbi:DUF1289 domain-containing protein [Acinetobacter sp. MD2(2019)]|uniref:DUF1289 domain-containing protein n=1 Tax=Acinetobacter sp. MD2(2019) TaxID=2605273 RepID=UPI002D1EF027|nr:DUF1289 domain-containing protein [Acinetobacter sp. MD2(2019)]MEB3755072.1 DUF1289 domain-containing protein [Acinetobacter sp. MD2(2019)]